MNDGGHSAASHRSHAAKDRDKARNRSPNNHSDGPGVNPSVIRAHTTKTTSKRRESVQYGQSRSSVAAPSESPVSATAEGSHPQGENETQRRQRSHTAGAIPIMGNEHSRQRLASPRASKPMDVPAPVPSPARIANRYNEDDFRPHAPPKGSSYGRAPVSVMPRNPHMPIPMAADHETASSPLFGPVHMDDPADMPSLEGVDRSSAVFRGSSNGSNLNREDTDLDDERIANIDPALTGRTTVDYEFEWTEPAEKVYVTGSFNNWARKYRMHRV